MGRNVVVCCDGTANEFAENNTNVVRLYSALIDDPQRQVIFYHPGVGTMEAPGALTTLGRKATVAAGSAFGYGLQNDIAAAYAFVMNSFKESEGDRLFLFGFSRGAYTVRAVASLLHACGVLRAGHETSILYAIRLLNSIRQDRPHIVDKFKSTFSCSECKPYFVGVWDTVSSVGWINNPLHVPYSANNPDIAIGRHAISIDERRAFYRPNRWIPADPPKPAGPKDLKQVWFAGAHCDVGGGYPEAEGGLSKIALKWMIKEAEAKGLLVDPARRDEVIAAGQGPDPNAMMHDEMKARPAWWVAEYVPKRRYDFQTGEKTWHINRGHARRLPPGALIHESVFARADYKPPLPADFQKVD